MKASLAAFVALTGTTAAYSVPEYLTDIRNQIFTSQCQIPIFGKEPGLPDSMRYCADHASAVFLQGPRALFPSVRKTCNGLDETDWGKYRANLETYRPTAFKKLGEVTGVPDLRSDTIPYVVFGDQEGQTIPGLRKAGVQPYSLVAVVCRNELFYGIWGDTGPENAAVGMSAALADLCYPTGQTDGLYCNETYRGDDIENQDPRNHAVIIAFSGEEAIPREPNWTGNLESFRESIRELGDWMVARLQGPAIKGSI